MVVVVLSSYSIELKTHFQYGLLYIPNPRKCLARARDDSHRGEGGAFLMPAPPLPLSTLLGGSKCHKMRLRKGKCHCVISSATHALTSTIFIRPPPKKKINSIETVIFSPSRELIIHRCYIFFFYYQWYL